MTSRRRSLCLWAPVLAYMGLIFALSSIEDPPAFPGRYADKGVHAVLYFGLGTLLVPALAGGWSRVVAPSTAAAAIVVAAFCGVSDEFHQSFVPTRQAAALDVIADAVGASVAAGGLFVRGRLAETKRTRGV